jgi:ribosomal protein S12
VKKADDSQETAKKTMRDVATKRTNNTNKKKSDPLHPAPKKIRVKLKASSMCASLLA